MHRALDEFRGAMRCAATVLAKRQRNRKSVAHNRRCLPSRMLGADAVAANRSAVIRAFWAASGRSMRPRSGPVNNFFRQCSSGRGRRFSRPPEARAEFALAIFGRTRKFSDSAETHIL